MSIHKLIERERHKPELFEYVRERERERRGN